MIDRFEQMIQKIIREDGFANYLPTLLLPTRRQVRVMDAQEDEQGQAIALSDWVAEQVEDGEDFLVAMKVDEAHFMVMGRIDGQACERLCAVE